MDQVGFPFFPQLAYGLISALTVEGMALGSHLEKKKMSSIPFSTPHSGLGEGRQEVAALGREIKMP